VAWADIITLLPPRRAARAPARPGADDLGAAPCGTQRPNAIRERRSRLPIPHAGFRAYRIPHLL